MLEIWLFKNPLQYDGRKNIACIPMEGETFKELFARIGLPIECEIYSDGQQVSINDTASDYNAISVVPKVEAEAAATWLIAAFEVESAIGIALAYGAAYIGVAIATNYLSSTLFGESGPSVGDSKFDSSGNAYSLTGSGNRARAYGVLPLVMAKHTRMTPDLAARPWSQYVLDPNNKRQQTIAVGGTRKACAASINDDGNWEPGRCPAYTTYEEGGYQEYDPPSGIVFEEFPYITGYDGAIYSIAYGKMSYRQADGLYSFNGSAWDSYDSVHPTVDYTEYVTGEVSETTQEVTNYYCAGIGDISYSDLRLGQVEVDKYTDLTLSFATQQSDRVLIGGDGVIHPNRPYTDELWPFNCYAVEGGTIRQNAYVDDSGWIKREYFGTDCKFIQIDLNGRLYKQGQNGYENATCDIEIQYRPTGSGAWISRPNASFTNADTFPVRETVGWAVAPGTPYEVRVRKITADSEDARLLNDFNFETVKFFRTDLADAANPFSLLAGTNIIGMALPASGQVQGSPDDLNMYVSSKCWVYTGASYDGTTPGQSGNWAWQTTENPAWWGLYYTMGIYRRSAPLGGHPLNGRGWIVGVDLADGPRMAGAGIPNRRIDFESWFLFAKFCDAQDLTINCVFMDQGSVQDALSKIVRAGRGSPSWYSGKLGIRYEDPNAVSVMTIGMGQIFANSFTINYIGDQAPQEIVASYTNPDDQWREGEVRREVPGYVLPESEAKIQLFGCNYKDQAQREANLSAARQHYQRRRITFSTNGSGFDIWRGDVITVAHDLLDWAYSGRVFAASGNVLTLTREIQETGAMTVQIQKPDGSVINTTGTANGDKLTVGVAIDFSEFDYAVPEDWLVFAGVTGIGKKFRVASVDPSDGTKYTITAVDEDPAMWAAEMTGVFADLPDSGERLVARAKNLYLDKDPCGTTYTLRWELENARLVDVQITRNGQSGVLRVHGDMLNVGSVTGSFAATVTPVAELTTVKVEGDSISVG